MDIKRTVTLYFSPTDGTRRIVHKVAEGLGAAEHLELDQTAFDSRYTGAKLEQGDVAVIGMPVYYGRVPRLLVEFFRYIEAQGIPAVIVVVYGNRDYEDALLELTNESRSHGFLPVAAGAFIGQHSFTDKLGTGRPDGDDLNKAKELGRTAAQLLAGTENPAAINLKVNGKLPYKPGADLPIAPVLDKEKCTRCMRCQKNCPVQAISPSDAGEVDVWRCLVCAKCIQECPAGALSLKNPALQEKIVIMGAMFAKPRQPELFYPA